MDELDTGEFEMDGEELDTGVVSLPPESAEADEDTPLLDEGDFVFVGWTHGI